MREFLARFRKETVFGQIDLLEGIIRDAVREDPWTPLADFERSLDGREPAAAATPGPGRPRRKMSEPGLKLFVEKRIESMEAQLDGKREGIRTGFMRVEPW